MSCVTFPVLGPGITSDKNVARLAKRLNIWKKNDSVSNVVATMFPRFTGPLLALGYTGTLLLFSMQSQKH